jgi:hypothetical protein
MYLNKRSIIKGSSHTDQEIAEIAQSWSQSYPKWLSSVMVALPKRYLPTESDTMSDFTVKGIAPSPPSPPINNEIWWK